MRRYSVFSSIILVALLLLFTEATSTSARVKAGATPQAQFFHARFVSQPLASTPDTGILITLSFSANQSGEIEVMSSESILDGSCCGGGGTIFATTDCQITLDGGVIASRHHDYTYTADEDSSLTTTSPVSSGTHVLRVACWGGPTDPTSTSLFTIESGGTSLIVATPATGN